MACGGMSVISMLPLVGGALADQAFADPDRLRMAFAPSSA